MCNNLTNSVGWSILTGHEPSTLHNRGTTMVPTISPAIAVQMRMFSLSLSERDGADIPQSKPTSSVAGCSMVYGAEAPRVHPAYAAVPVGRAAAGLGHVIGRPRWPRLVVRLFPRDAIFVIAGGTCQDVRMASRGVLD